MKTSIVLAVLAAFVLSNQAYNAFAVSQQTVDLTEFCATPETDGKRKLACISYKLNSDTFDTTPRI